MKTLILIPAYNEEKTIANTLKEVLALDGKFSVLVIDDGSTDNTAQIVSKKKVGLLSHPFNMGYGIALQTGYKYALQHDFYYIVQIDADGQHDPKFIKDLLKPLNEEKADLVVGSRFLKFSYKMPLIRKVGVFFFRWIIKSLTNYRITDPTSGFRAFKRPLLNILATDVYPTDFPDADLLITLIRGGIKVKEIPVKMYQSPIGKKPMHSGIVPLYYIFKVPLSILIGLLRSKNIIIK